MTTAAPALDCTQSVNAIVAAHPATLAVFTAWGIDTCCGGEHAVQEVVRRHGLDGTALCAALSAAGRLG
jgi:iron-sulfur cluster repair protein YtfE (RIC family)